MTKAAERESGNEDRPGRWALIRDAFTFQIKLLLDGLRDLVFAPVSIVLALIDLISGGNRFYNLMQLGHRSDKWINLFGTHNGPGQGVDEAVSKLETMIAEQYEKGGITASAKRSVDKALDKLGKKHPDTNQNNQS